MVKNEGRTGIINNGMEAESLIPTVAENFFSLDWYDDVEAILRSGIAHNIYVSGPSGTGKTMPIEQICAKLGRGCVRVNITADTDEDDLLGGLRLVDGDTQFELGPVPQAMERGDVLLLDEVDLGSPKMMCLQPVLEHRPVLIKKVGRVVVPKKGFIVIATANTKGQSDATGKYIGTNPMNEAFLERFPITIEANWPPDRIERKMVEKELDLCGYRSTEEFMTAPELSERWVNWANQTRASVASQTTDALISTRRLMFMVRSFCIFKDELKAAAYCVARFEENEQKSMVEVLTKLIPSNSKEDSSTATPDLSPDDEKIMDILTSPSNHVKSSAQAGQSQGYATTQGGAVSSKPLPKKNP